MEEKYICKNYVSLIQTKNVANLPNLKPLSLLSVKIKSNIFAKFSDSKIKQKKNTRIYCLHLPSIIYHKLSAKYIDYKHLIGLKEVEGELEDQWPKIFLYCNQLRMGNFSRCWQIFDIFLLKIGFNENSMDLKINVIQ